MLRRGYRDVAAGVARIADRTTAYLKRRPLGTPLGGLLLVGAEDAEAAMTAIRLDGVKRVCLADQARGCEDDARDKCSEAAIQQDFIKDLGHDSFHSRTP